MQVPKKPLNEKERLEALKSYRLLDTPNEEAYDNLTAMLADYCGVPIALVTLLDEKRNFLKSHHGVPFNESPRDISFCGHAIVETKEIYIVEDARKDDRFKENPIVTEQGAVFYAGIPLIGPEGFPLGTLCVYDTKPRELNENQKNMLRILAKQIISLFVLHKSNEELKTKQELLETNNKRLKEFAGVVTHDLKSPLANITSLSRMLKEEYYSHFDKQGIEYLDYLEESSNKLATYIEVMLKYYRSEEISRAEQEEVDLTSIFYEIERMLFFNNELFKYPKNIKKIRVNKPALEQILMNLISNSLKYNTNETPSVEITFNETTDNYIFSVIDNGMGIDKEKQKHIFDLFNTANNMDKDGKKGTGIGLATVEKIVSGLRGVITVTSKKGKGTTFTFTVPK